MLPAQSSMDMSRFEGSEYMQPIKPVVTLERHTRSSLFEPLTRHQKCGQMGLMKDQKISDLHPSLASLGDGLLCRVGSQRDEAKKQASITAQDLNPGPMPGQPVIKSWTRLKSDVSRLNAYNYIPDEVNLQSAYFGSTSICLLQPAYTHDMLQSIADHSVGSTLAEHWQNKTVPGVQGKEESEVRVGLDDSGLPINSATLIEVQLPPGLQHRVQAVQHCGVAQVGAVQQHPLPCLNGLCQGPIHPLKSAAGNSDRNQGEFRVLALHSQVIEEQHCLRQDCN